MRAGERSSAAHRAGATSCRPPSWPHQHPWVAGRLHYRPRPAPSPTRQPTSSSLHPPRTQGTCPFDAYTHTHALFLTHERTHTHTHGRTHTHLPRCGPWRCSGSTACCPPAATRCRTAPHRRRHTAARRRRPPRLRLPRRCPALALAAGTQSRSRPADGIRLVQGLVRSGPGDRPGH